MNYKICLLTAILLVIAFVSIRLYFPPIWYQKASTVENLADKPKLEGLLKAICACESAGSPTATPTHFDLDGKVIRGKKNSQDVGICQINLDWHNDKAKKIGLDLFKENDNIKYAKILFASEGSKPWNWSKSCWK